MVKVKYILCISCFLVSCPIIATNDDYIKEIRKEASHLKKSAEHKILKAKEDSIFKGWIAYQKGGVKIHGDTRRHPSLRTLNAPLAFFYLRFYENELDYWKNQAFLDAVVHSSDVKKRQALVLFIKKNFQHKFKNNSVQWAFMVTKSGTKKWANVFLSKHKSTKDSYTAKLLYFTIKYWIHVLSKKNKIIAFKKLKALIKEPLFNRSPNELFKTMHKIKSKETVLYLIDYLGTKKNKPYFDDHDIIDLILTFNYKFQNQSAYKKLNEFQVNLNRKRDKFILRKIDDLLFYFNPEQGKLELKAYIKHVLSNDIIEGRFYHFYEILNIYAFANDITENDIALLKKCFLTVKKFGASNRLIIFKAFYQKNLNYQELLLKVIENKAHQENKNLLEQITYFLSKEKSSKSKALIKLINNQ